MSKARVVVEDLTPQVDCGRFPARRVLGDTVVVEADVFADGHDAVAAHLLYRHESEAQWHGMPMSFIGNDRWQGRFTAQALGRYLFTVEAWVDHLESWRRGLEKKHAAAQDIEIELQQGAALALAHAGRVAKPDARRLREWAKARPIPRANARSARCSRKAMSCTRSRGAAPTRSSSSAASHRSPSRSTGSARGSRVGMRCFRAPPLPPLSPRLISDIGYIKVNCRKSVFTGCHPGGP